MLIVYRLEESLGDFNKGEYISHETLRKFVEDGWYDIKVTIIVVN